MKKTLLALIAFITLITFSVFSQEPGDWERIHDIEEYFRLFEVEVEVWYNPIDLVLNFEDSYSQNFDDMLFQWGYLMSAFEFMLDDSGQDFEDVDVEIMIYSFFNIVDPRISKYDEPNMRYDVYMERDWAIEFFGTSRRDRQNMLYDLFEDHYMGWFPQKRAY